VCKIVHGLELLKFSSFIIFNCHSYVERIRTTRLPFNNFIYNLDPYFLVLQPANDAFSYAWSLPVTWQRWRSHRWIRHTRETHDTRKPCGSIFYRTGVIGDRSLHCGNQDCRPYCSCDLDLAQMREMTVICELDPHFREIHRMCKMNFLLQGFRKSSDTAGPNLKGLQARSCPPPKVKKRACKYGIPCLDDYV